MNDNTESSTNSSRYLPVRMVDLLASFQDLLQEDLWCVNSSVGTQGEDAALEDLSTENNNIDEDEAKDKAQENTITALTNLHLPSTDSLSLSFITQKERNILQSSADTKNKSEVNEVNSNLSRNKEIRNPLKECNKEQVGSAQNTLRPWYVRPPSSIRKPLQPVSRNEAATLQPSQKFSLFAQTNANSTLLNESDKGMFIKHTLSTVKEQDSPLSDGSMAPNETSTPFKGGTNSNTNFTTNHNISPPSVILPLLKKTVVYTTVSSIQDSVAPNTSVNSISATSFSLGRPVTNSITSPPNTSISCATKQSLLLNHSTKVSSSSSVSLVSSLPATIMSSSKEVNSILPNLSKYTPSPTPLVNNSNSCNNISSSVIKHSSMQGVLSDPQRQEFPTPAQENSRVLNIGDVPTTKASGDVINPESVLSAVVNPHDVPPKSQILYSDPPLLSQSSSQLAKNVETKQPTENDKGIRSESKPNQRLLFKTLVVHGKPYTILSKIGIGGSSEVLKVLDPVDSSLYAVKCVNMAVEPALAQGFVNEIKLLHKLQHSGRVVTMFDYEYAKKSKMLHVVLELGETDLAMLLKSHTAEKTLPGPLVLAYWTEMLYAVNHIHANGIIHSDLKPANFLLVRGRLKLIDFGIASSISVDATSVIKDTATGTFNYISPEAVFGQQGGEQIKISVKSDVWSLGCILYSLIYGKTPFSHITNNRAKMAALGNSKQVIEYPSVTHVPVTLVQALKWCLTYDPKKRPTVKELLELPYMEANKTETELPLSIKMKIRLALTSQEWQMVSKVLKWTDNHIGDPQEKSHSSLHNNNR